jgi:hypothetical protein
VGGVVERLLDLFVFKSHGVSPLRQRRPA